MDIPELKRLAGERVVDYVQDGMAVGLGTGSTVYFALLRLSERVHLGLRVKCVPTSRATEELARKLALPLMEPTLQGELDLVIDGADEVDPHCNLIKGGGGALLREKIAAAASKKLIIVVDETKLKDHLGGAPLPVEVVPFGWRATQRHLERLGCRAVRRERAGEPFLTDNGNYIIDCHFGRIAEPAALEREIKLIPGVVECGLFVGLADRIIVGRRSGLEEITCPPRSRSGSASAYACAF